MTTKPRSLIAVFAVLALLFSQQAAWAHLIGHLGSHALSEAATPPHQDHDENDASSDVCHDCLAFAALDAGPASGVCLSDAGGALVVGFVAVFSPSGETVSHSFLARAPPVVF
jgi:hypothetical protein